MLVEDNAGAMADCDFEKIVCTDPHSYNTFENEYPEMAAELGVEFDYPVFHYTQVLQTLVGDGRLNLGSVDRTVTYHDPCHLGRYNGVFETPRDVVRATGADLVEMPRNRKDSFCCGGGGGGLWLDQDEHTKPSEERLREATEDTERVPEQFVVACPMCATMYEDGRKTGGFEDELEIVDVSELVVEALDARAGASSAGTTPSAAD
jgi:Fe-S oxidoreductase